MLLAPGLVPGIPSYTVKVHAKFPGLDPAIQGVIVLQDIMTGHPLALLESTLITAVRTGLAGALGADVLARADAKDVAIVGAGAQGVLQLECLRHVRQIRDVTVYDTAQGKAQQFARNESAKYDFRIVAAPSLAACVAEADIIVTSTWATAPFLFPGMLKPGVHITTLGPDQPGKCEVSADLLRVATFVCDDRSLAVDMGAIGGASLGADAIHAELGEVIAGTKAGRRSDGDITVFGSVGLAFQDLVVAWDVYEAARSKGIGRSISLLGGSSV